jgi:hypothetical protein
MQSIIVYNYVTLCNYFNLKSNCIIKSNETSMYCLWVYDDGTEQKRENCINLEEIVIANFVLNQRIAT